MNIASISNSNLHMDIAEHYCEDNNLPLNKFFQERKGVGKNVLILGEAPAPNGWRKSGIAFYSPKGKLIPSGKNLNKLLAPFNLSIEICNFTELVKCYHGKSRRLLLECGKKCWPIFLKQIKRYDISLVISLGVETLKLFNKFSKQQVLIGKISEVKIEGKIYKILPIYHPSTINSHNHPKNVEIFKFLEQDLKSLITVST